MSDSVKQGLLSAYATLLRPLVRILVRHGVSFNEFSEVLKGVYTDVAESDFGIPGKRSSQSRIAILTGLTRKDVARLKSKKSLIGLDDDSGNLNRVTRVLVGWHTDKQYTGPYGLPLEVPFDSDNQVSFTELVRRYSGDMAPRAMLDELLRVRAVEEVDQGWYRVLTRSYIPEPLHADAIERLGGVLRNFVRTVEVNLEKKSPGTGRFERIVYADDGLRVDRLADFDRLIRAKGQGFLEELDDWLSSHASDQSQDDFPRIQAGVGIYHYIEEESEPIVAEYMAETERREQIQNVSEKDEPNG